MTKNVTWGQANGDQSMVAQPPSSALGPDGLACMRIPFGRVTIPLSPAAAVDPNAPPYFPIVAIQIGGHDFRDCVCGNFQFQVNTCLARIAWWLDGLNQVGAGATPPPIQFAIKLGSGGEAMETVLTGTLDGGAVPANWVWSATGLIGEVQGLLAGRAEFWACVLSDDPANRAYDILLSADFDRLGGATTLTSGNLVT